MIHKACMPVYIVIQIFLADGRAYNSTRGSTRGPRGPKKDWPKTHIQT